MSQDETNSSKEIEPYSYDLELEEELEESSHVRFRAGVKIFAVISLVSILIVGAFLLGARYKNSRNTPSGTTGVQNPTVNNTGSLTEQQLRNLVKSSHLTVYWVGPIEGDKYSVLVPRAGVAVIKYLTAGNGLNDTAPNYRVIGTYLQADATTAVQTAGKKEGSVGFTNVDGNAVFYVRARPTNVYVAIKDKDVQVEIFDPIADQSLALALFKGQLQQIK